MSGADGRELDLFSVGPGKAQEKTTACLGKAPGKPRAPHGQVINGGHPRNRDENMKMEIENSLLQ